MEIATGVFEFPIEADYVGRTIAVHLAGVETRHGLILIDAGTPDGGEVIEEAFRSDGFGFDDVAAILVTHQDLDHVGALPEIAEQTGADVITHREAEPYVSGREPLVKRPESGYAGAPVDLSLVGSEVFHTEAGPMRVVPTPGHTPGHVSLYLPEERLLVSGDALTNPGGDGLSGPPEGMTLDMEEAISSLGPLADLDIERILCYHGGLAEEGTDRIRELFEAGP